MDCFCVYAIVFHTESAKAKHHFPLTPFFSVTIFYLSTSSLRSICSHYPSLSQQEVKVACALASALHSLCPSRSCSVNDKMNVPIPIIYLGNHMPVYYWVSLRNTYSNSFIPGNAKHSRLPKISG